MEATRDMNVVIVNFRTPKLTTRCVSSLLERDIAQAENVVVVDNASPDDSYRQLRQHLPQPVRLLHPYMNRGFGAGVNFGIAACLHRFVLVLNPDTYVIDSSIEKAIEVMKARAEVGLVGLELTYPNGERQYSARRFYSMLDIVGRRTPLGRLELLHERMARHLMMEAWNPGVPFDADWVMGAGFIVRRALYEELGGMDEMYFLFMEDVDLCARIWQAGYRVACVPGARLVHEHQRASAQGPLTSAARHHLHSLLRFSKKFRVPLAWPPGLHRLQR